MSALLKAQGILRVFQIIFALAGMSLLIWLRTTGYATADNWQGLVRIEASQTAGRTMGTAYIAFAIIACSVGTIVAISTIIYCIRSHYASHSTKFHMMRLFADILTFILILIANIIFRLTPGGFARVYRPTRWTNDTPWQFISAGSLACFAIFNGIVAVCGILTLVETSKARRSNIRMEQQTYGQQNADYSMIQNPSPHQFKTDIPVPRQPYQSKPSFDHVDTSYPTSDGEGNGNGRRVSYTHYGYGSRAYHNSPDRQPLAQSYQ